MYSCAEKTLTNGSFDGYNRLFNCTCAFCDDACQAPRVNADIGFFDGFNGGLVGMVYFYLILASIVFQVLKAYFANKKRPE